MDSLWLWGGGTASGEDLNNEIISCSKIKDTLNRLNCYDVISKKISTKSRTSQKLEPIEFMELVKIFSFNEKDFASAFAWDIAAKNKSINWSTPLMVEAKKKDDLPYIKKGEVLVMVNKTSCKSADGTDVKWGIRMSGPRMGVFNVQIQPKIMGFCSAKLEERVKPFSSAKELGCDFCN